MVVECEVVSSPVPIKDSSDVYTSYISAEELLEWIDENVLEIINRENFTTVTVSSKNGPRAFRVSGPDCFHRALIKARVFKETM